MVDELIVRSMIMMIFVDELAQIAKQMYDRILKLEADKYDINYVVRQKDFEVH